MRWIHEVIRILNDVVPIVHLVFIHALKYHDVCVVDPAFPVPVVPPVLGPLHFIRPLGPECADINLFVNVLGPNPVQAYYQQDPIAHPDLKMMLFGFHF